VTVGSGTGGTLSVTFVAPAPGPTTQVVFDVTGLLSVLIDRRPEVRTPQVCYGQSELHTSATLCFILHRSTPFGPFGPGTKARLSRPFSM